MRLGRDFELLPHSLDVGNRRQSRLVAETLDLVGRCRARKLKMVVPAFAGMGEIRINIGAMEYVAGAVGVEHAVARDRERRQRMNSGGLVVPEQALFAHG